MLKTVPYIYYTDLADRVDDHNLHLAYDHANSLREIDMIKAVIWINGNSPGIVPVISDLLSSRWIQLFDVYCAITPKNRLHIGDVPNNFHIVSTRYASDPTCSAILVSEIMSSHMVLDLEIPFILLSTDTSLMEVASNLSYMNRKSYLLNTKFSMSAFCESWIVGGAKGTNFMHYLLPVFDIHGSLEPGRIDRIFELLDHNGGSISILNLGRNIILAKGEDKWINILSNPYNLILLGCDIYKGLDIEGHSCLYLRRVTQPVYINASKIILS